MTTKQLVSVRVEPELWQKVRMECLRRGLPAHSAVTEALSHWLMDSQRAFPPGVVDTRFSGGNSAGALDPRRQKLDSFAANGRHEDADAARGDLKYEPEE